MVIAVRVEQDDHGLVVVKEARTDGDVARLTREVELLAAARNKGVVALLEVSERSVRLQHGGTALARLGPFPLHETAGIVAAVADALHAVHRAGVAHNDLDAAHVVLDAHGTPRICGFGQASHHTDVAAADDVAALGRLLSTQLAVGAGLRTPMKRRKTAAARRELEALAQRCQHDDPGRRPSARQVAKAIHASVPEATLPVGDIAPRADTAGFAEIPDDVSPTSDLSWSAADLSFLAVTDDQPGGHTLSPGSANPYVALASDSDAPEPMAPGPADVDRARITVAPDTPLGPVETPEAVPLRAPDVEVERPRGRGLRRGLAGLVVLALGVAGGVAGARAVDPVDLHRTAHVHVGAGAAHTTQLASTLPRVRRPGPGHRR